MITSRGQQTINRIICRRKRGDAAYSARSDNIIIQLREFTVAHCVDEVAQTRLDHDSFFMRSVGLWRHGRKALSHETAASREFVQRRLMLQNLNGVRDNLTARFCELDRGSDSGGGNSLGGRYSRESGMLERRK
jgi:hypothetical protein